MKRGSIVLLVLMLCITMPLLAQEKAAEKGEETADKKEMTEHAEMAPPPALDDDLCKWLVGEWEGWSEGPKGKHSEWEKIEMGLNGQVLLREAVSKTNDGEYAGMGGMTINAESGEFMGYWMDNHRGMYQGKGKREGDKLTMEWQGYQGTYTNVLEKVDENTYTATWSFTDAGGNTMEGKSEMKRKEAPATTMKE